VGLAAVSLCLLWRPTVAQSLVELRYDPPVGTRVHAISRADVHMIVGLGDPALNDTVSVEAMRLESFTAYVSAADAGRYSVIISYDSVRARRRAVGGTWRTLEPALRDTATARALLDSRMRVLAAELSSLPHLRVTGEEVLRGLAGGPWIPLPEGPVAVSNAWPTDLGYPLSVLAGVAADEGVPATGVLSTEGTATLDSIQARGSDTLAFISARGRFAPAVVGPASPDGAGSVTASGSVGAALVWSSRAQTFVTAASRAVISLAVVRDPNDRSGDARLQFDVSTETRVRW